MDTPKRRYQEILDGYVKLEHGDAGLGLAPERARISFGLVTV